MSFSKHFTSRNSMHIARRNFFKSSFIPPHLTLILAGIFPFELGSAQHHGMQETFDDNQVVEDMLEKMRKRECEKARCLRVCALISIVFVLGMSMSPLTELLVEDTAGELPTIHDSTAPDETGWVLVGFKRYIEQDSHAMSYAYLALFCREVGDHQYQFKFRWHDSPCITLPYEGEEAVNEDYYFMGLVYRDNGCDRDPDLIWDAGMIGNSNAGEYETQTSDTIQIHDWTGIRFCGALMTHSTVESSFMEKLHGLILKIEVGIMIGVSYGINPILGIIATVAGVLFLTWYEEECLQDDDLNIYYHAFYGGLDLLNSPGACVQVQVFTKNGYDLPDVLEASPADRKYVDQFDISVQCAFPSKLSMDAYMMYKDLESGLFEDQALSRIDIGGGGEPRIVVLDFPRSKIKTPFDSLSTRRMELEWDLSSQYFNFNAFSNEDIRNNLHSGKFVPLDERYQYLRQLGVSDWNIPSVQFQIKVEIDYELPVDIADLYPADPLYTIYQEQRLCTALDYYTLGHTVQNSRIERDNHSDFTVYLGDETIAQTTVSPLIPIYIGWEMLEDQGVFIDMPEGLHDLVVLSPEIHGVIADITDEDDPDRQFAIADPVGWRDGYDALFDEATLKHFPIHSITVPDPEKTIYFLPQPGIIPESLKVDPPPFAVDGGIGQAIEENALNWKSLWGDVTGGYEGAAYSELQRRTQFALRVEPGIPGDDLLPIYVEDPDSQYQIGIQLPGGDQLDLITLNQPTEDEIGSFTIREGPSYVMIPGTEEFEEENEGFIAIIPVEEDGIHMTFRPMNRTGDTVWLNTLPTPEKHTMLTIEDRVWAEGTYDAANESWTGDNIVTVSIVDDGANTPVRELDTLTYGPVSDPFFIGNFIHVDQDVVGITTYTPEFGFDLLPRAHCYLDSDPNALLMDLDPSCESGFHVSVDPAIPRYSALNMLEPENVIFEMTLSHDPWADDEMGLIVSETTTASDGVLIRGLSSFASPAPFWEVASWIASPAYVHRDVVRSRPGHGDLMYSRHILNPDIVEGEYEFLVQHPGEDGEFFSFGSVSQDEQYIIENGIRMFVSSARQSSDDLFALKTVIIEAIDMSMDIEERVDDMLSINGVWNRLDGVALNVTMDDGNGNSKENVTHTMFGEYSLEIDTGGLPGGTYVLQVMDQDGNVMETTLEVQNGGLG